MGLLHIKMLPQSIFTKFYAKKDPKLHSHSHSIFLNCHDFQSYPNIIEETMETCGNISYQVSCKKRLLIALPFNFSKLSWFPIMPKCKRWNYGIYRNIFTKFHAKKDSKLHSHSSFLNCHDFQSYPNNCGHKSMETYGS